MVLNRVQEISVSFSTSSADFRDNDDADRDLIKVMINNIKGHVQILRICFLIPVITP